jgi:hypothetical protein
MNVLSFSTPLYRGEHLFSWITSSILHDCINRSNVVYCKNQHSVCVHPECMRFDAILLMTQFFIIGCIIYFKFMCGSLHSSLAVKLIYKPCSMMSYFVTNVRELGDRKFGNFHFHILNTHLICKFFSCEVKFFMAEVNLVHKMLFVESTYLNLPISYSGLNITLGTIFNLMHRDETYW